jgi:ATP-binding cassette subfamily B protein/subfamily B ATP-binding cassette protein MsbA
VQKKPEATTASWHTYWRLLRYAFADWRGWGLIVVVTLLSSAFGLLQPWPMKVLVDHVLDTEPMPHWLAWGVEMLPGAQTSRGLLVWVVFAGLGIFAFNSLVDVILTRAWIRVGQQLVYRVAADLFARALRRSLVFHSRNSVGDLLSRITGDSWCVYKVVDALLFTPKYALIMIVGMLLLMVRMDPGLTLLALAAAPFMAWSSIVLGRPIRRAAQARREIESHLQSHVQQTLTGIPVVQAFAQEEREQQRFEEATAKAIRAQQRSALVGSISGLTSGLALTLGTGIVLWAGARHVLAGELSLGSLLVFLAYLAALQGQLKALTGIHTALQEIGASVDRVAGLLTNEPEVKELPEAPALSQVKGHLRLERVTFGYEPERPVLHNVSLEVRSGQTVALVGATGAGKTTLASLVPRFFDPWQGRVLVDGHDIRTVQLGSLREQVGLVLQEPFLFPVSMADNIAFGRPGASRDDIEVAARAANLHDFIQRLPHGYETVIGEHGETLSGGERQRLSIARALVKNAPILILDEPTSALDAETERLFLQALARLMRGRTTLIIAHRLSTVRHADQIVVLQHGYVVEAGTHSDLLAQDGLYARLYEMQSGKRRPVTEARETPLAAGERVGEGVV